MKNIHIAAALFSFKNEKQIFENIRGAKIKNCCKGSISVFQQPFPVSYIPLCLKNENKNKSAEMFVTVIEKRQVEKSISILSHIFPPIYSTFRKERDASVRT